MQFYIAVGVVVEKSDFPFVFCWIPRSLNATDLYIDPFRDLFEHFLAYRKNPFNLTKQKTQFFWAGDLT